MVVLDAPASLCRRCGLALTEARGCTLTYEQARHAERCEAYLKARTGSYSYRSVRYAYAASHMLHLGLNNDSLVVDVGAGWTELDAFMRKLNWRGRYYPVDGMFDGTDLEVWTPPRKADFFVALEVLEHLADPWHLLRDLRRCATTAVLVSVPNPRTTDVLGMDPTHRTVITQADLEIWGFKVTERMFYGQPNDSLFGVWTK